MKEKFKRGKRTKDLTGKVFGKLTVLEFAGYKKQNNGLSKAQWGCVCECGNRRIILADLLKRGRLTSCGTCNSIKVGDIFGDLTILGFAGYKIIGNGTRKSQWLCLCACGAKKIILDNSLKANRTKSCGNCNPIRIGDKFGKLIAIKPAGYRKEKSGKSRMHWLCQCSCRNIIIVSLDCLKSGHTRSCGCLSKQPNGGYSEKYNFSYDSFWELNFVKILEYLEVEWKREPKIFKLSNGKRYIPDFYLPEFNMFIEIKGRWYKGAKEKTELFKKEYPQYNYYVIDEFKYKEIENHFKFLLK